MSPRLFAIVAGIALIIAGIVVAVIPGSVSVTQANPLTPGVIKVIDAECGTTSVPLGAKLTDVQVACDAQSSVVQWLLIGLGVVLVAGGALIRTRPAVPATT